jgi:large subunit ribosomal protein L31
MCTSAQGSGTVLVTDDGQLNKFKKRFAGLGEMAEINTAAASSPAAKLEEVKKPAGKGKGKKK